jgi:transcriptional regulator with XRE-family HTH domain
MEDHSLSSSQMADKIGVQRSAISHILSGRNKPSLDFILKLLRAFSDVSSDWLLKGEKQVQKSSEKTMSKSSQFRSSKSIEKILVLYSDKSVEEYQAFDQ